MPRVRVRVRVTTNGGLGARSEVECRLLSSVGSTAGLGMQNRTAVELYGYRGIELYGCMATGI